MKKNIYPIVFRKLQKTFTNFVRKLYVFQEQKITTAR